MIGFLILSLALGCAVFVREIHYLVRDFREWMRPERAASPRAARSTPPFYMDQIEWRFPECPKP